MNACLLSDNPLADVRMPELNFDQLPLVEVVCRFLLESRIPVNPAMVVDFAAASKERYPIVRESSELHGWAGAAFEIESASSMLGFSVANADGIDISIQRRAIVVKWSGELGDDGVPDPPYPRYEGHLRFALTEALKILEDLLGGGAIQVRVVNMQYTNLISHEGPLVGDCLTSRFTTFNPAILPDFQSLQSFNCAYRNQKGIDIRLTYDAVNLPIAGYAARCVAGRFLEEPVTSEGALNVLDEAHEACKLTFDQTLTPEVRVEWKQR